MLPKVSVITPVFNAEKYLGECIHSIINQSLREIEIIFIDDGSTDSSLNILKQYAQADSRIKIIEQKNCGGGIARNEGIKQAQGEYIGFVDADDWLDSNYYECLYYSAKKNQAEIVRTLQLRYYADNKIKEPKQNKIIQSRFQRGEHLKKNDHSFSVLVGLYKRDLLTRHSIFFDVTRSSHDKLFIIKAMFFSKKTIPAVDTFYHHRDNVPGQLTTFNHTRLVNASCADRSIVKFLNSVKYDDVSDYIEIFEKLLIEVDAYFNRAISGSIISKKELKKYFEGMMHIYKQCKYKDLLFEGKNLLFFSVLKKKSFKRYYSFCKNKEEELALVEQMNLRDFFGKIRRKLLKLFFGRELVNNIIKIDQISEAITSLRDVINVNLEPLCRLPPSNLKAKELQGIVAEQPVFEQVQFLNFLLEKNKMIPCKKMYALDEKKYQFVLENEYIRAASLALISKEIYDKNIGGSVVELGVFRGDFAKLINETFPDRKLYLFDTFEGFDKEEVEMEIKNGYLKGNKDDFSKTSIKLVLSKMKHRENCIVKKGHFPESLTEDIVNEKFAFVSLDADLYEPTYAGLHYFYEKLNRGGYIMIHDYTVNRYAGVKAALRKFSEEKKVGYVPICDSAGSVIIMKG